MFAPNNLICIVRSALTGFQPDWELQKAAVPLTSVNSLVNSLVNSDTKLVHINQFDYAADDSEDDTKEATSISIRKHTKDKELSKVHPTEFHLS